MHYYALLRLLLASFFFYMAWPYITNASSSLALLFWGSWTVLYLLIFGSNFATLLQVTKPPIIEQEPDRRRETHND